MTLSARRNVQKSFAIFISTSLTCKMLLPCFAPSLHMGLDAGFTHLTHPVVKLLLVSAISLDLACRGREDCNTRTRDEVLRTPGLQRTMMKLKLLQSSKNLSCSSWL